MRSCEHVHSCIHAHRSSSWKGSRLCRTLEPTQLATVAEEPIDLLLILYQVNLRRQGNLPVGLTQDYVQSIMADVTISCPKIL